MSSGPLREKLLDAVDSFGGCSILVIGDIMLDQFVWGEVRRISPEAPVPVVEVEKESLLLGGSANVANNLRSLDARPILAGTVGTDAYGARVLNLCNKNSIDTSGVVQDEKRPTTLKTRIIARGQQVVRVDREDGTPLEKGTVERLLAQLDKDLLRSQAVIVSDYNKGVVSSKLLEKVIKRSKVSNTQVLIDPKPVNALCYKGADVITPNKKEAEELSSLCASKEEEIEKVAQAISKNLQIRTVLITRGPEGMALWQKEKGMFTIPTMAREVFDVTGAGDTVISLMALGLVVGLTPCEAALLANVAAGIVVGKIGTATVSRHELKEAIRRVPEDSIRFNGHGF